MPQVSLIINNHRGISELQDCLQSVMNSYYPTFEIIVVDCLTKGIDQWIKKNFPNVKLIHFDHDIGPSAQCNVGLKLASTNSRYVVFMDNDVEVEKNWLRILVQTMESDSTIGAAQPKILTKHKNDELDSIGCFIDVIGFPHRACFVYGAKHVPKGIKEVFYAEGATLLARNDLLRKLQKLGGPFDSTYFIHWKDIDFCWKIWLMNHRVVVVPDSVAYHDRGVSRGLRMLPSHHIYLNTRNRFITLIRNYDKWSLIRFLPFSIAFELVKDVMLLHVKPDHSVASLKAILWVLRNLKENWKKHIEVQQLITGASEKRIKGLFLTFNMRRLYHSFRKHYTS